MARGVRRLEPEGERGPRTRQGALSARACPLRGARAGLGSMLRPAWGMEEGRRFPSGGGIGTQVARYADMETNDKTRPPPSPLLVFIVYAIGMGGRGRYAEALRVLDAVIAHTGNLWVRHERALLCAKMGDRARAEDEWRIVQAIDPRGPRWKRT